MKALILAAGYGKRLGELTKDFPKALIKVRGEAILDRSIKKLLNLGISEITVNTHFKSELVLSHLESSFPNHHFRIFHEPKLMGTAGTLKANVNWLSEDDFLVMHGDNYFSDNLQELIKKPENSNVLASIATFNTDFPSECGVFTTSKSGEVIAFLEKNKFAKSTLANAAIYYFSKKTKNIILNLAEDESDISLHLIPKLIGRINLVPLSGEFADIGTIGSLSKLNECSNVHAKD